MYKISFLQDAIHICLHIGMWNCVFVYVTDQQELTPSLLSWRHCHCNGSDHVNTGSGACARGLFAGGGGKGGMQAARGEWGLPFHTGLSLFQSKVRGIWHLVLSKSAGMTIHNREAVYFHLYVLYLSSVFCIPCIIINAIFMSLPCFLLTVHCFLMYSSFPCCSWFCTLVLLPHFCPNVPLLVP